MGLFDPFSGIIDRPGKSLLGDSIERKIRGDIEDFIDDISPELGKVVRRTNNFKDTLDNAQDSADKGGARIIAEILDIDEPNFDLADHLYIQKLGYTHHGLYIGNNRVIHYIDGEIQETSLDSFADGSKVFVKQEYESPINYSTREVISRAKRRIGESKYNLGTNNCENFVRWCRAGGRKY